LAGTPPTYEEVRSACEAIAAKPFGYDQLRGNLAWISKFAMTITGTQEGPFKINDMGRELEKDEQ
jgi:hypothetical protein